MLATNLLHAQVLEKNYLADIDSLEIRATTVLLPAMFMRVPNRSVADATEAICHFAFNYNFCTIKASSLGLIPLKSSLKKTLT